jgi:hypothetical protein
MTHLALLNGVYLDPEEREPAILKDSDRLAI